MTAPFLRRPASLRDESGIILPLTLLVVSLVLLMGGIAVSQSVFAENSATGDRQVKRALQAADAGIAAAVYRMNVNNVVNLSATQKCVSPGGALGGYSTIDTNGTQWCPAIGETLADGTSYSYAVSQELGPVQIGGVSYLRRQIVSTGSAVGETRRVAVDSEAALPNPLFGSWGVSSLQSISMNSNAYIEGSVRTNQSLTFGSGANVRCMTDGLLPALGDATSGPGYPAPSDARVCGTNTSAPQTFTLPPVGNEPAVNDNARICAAGGDVCTNGPISWSASTRRLSLDSDATLTLGGNVYTFCNLSLNSNSRLIIPAKPPGSPPVRIYIDRPEDCTGSPRGSISLDSNTTILNQTGDPTMLQIYVQGSPTINTTVSFNSNSASPFPLVIYAPQSAVSFNSNSYLLGAVAGRSVSFDSNAFVKYDRRVAAISTESAFPLLRQKLYRECRQPAPSGGPGAGC